MSDKHVSGWHTVEAICKELNLRNKAILSATHNRHRVSTIFSSEDLIENEKELFYKHMGHSGDINEKVYQVPPAIREVIQIGKRLDSIDKS